MACSIDEQWKPLVKYLYYYGITRDGMRRMLTIKPMVFCADLQKTIVPKVCKHFLLFSFIRLVRLVVKVAAGTI